MSLGRPISAALRPASRETWLVFELRKVDGWKRIDPGSIPKEGKFAGYRMCKCANRNAFTHSHIRAKVPHVGVEPASSTHSAQNFKQLTKYESPMPAILDIYRPRRHRQSQEIADLADFPPMSARPGGIPTDPNDIADFWRGRRGRRAFSPIRTDLPGLADLTKNQRTERDRRESAGILAYLAYFDGESARSARILTDLAENRRDRRVREVGEICNNSKSDA